MSSLFSASAVVMCHDCMPSISPQKTERGERKSSNFLAAVGDQ